MASIKNPVKYFDENPVEKQVREGVKNTTRVAKEELQKEVSIAWRQLLGKTNEVDENKIKQPQKETRVQGELVEGVEVDILNKEQWINVAPGINYKEEILNQGERTLKRENRELRERIEEIKIELVKLSKSSKQLQTAFREVSVEVLPKDPGSYHLNFFEWMLSVIRNARMRVDESNAWLNVTTKKAKNKSYWNLAKKHGTTFSLSGERVVATQVG